MALRYKPKEQQLRIVFTSEPHRAIPDTPVCAVIGPFNSFDDKAAIRDALIALIRGWNVEVDPDQP